ncbi:hypothetical protein F5I97DRAFT_1830621 [Phlebopus sp. FC_14]|nr:hypothetical protein F5I97DRAFT_1830621 [Phlebopus sp. FC_14]
MRGVTQLIISFTTVLKRGKKHLTSNMNTVPILRAPQEPLQFLGYSLSYDQLAEYARQEQFCKNARKDPGVSNLALDATQHIKARFNPQLESVVMRAGDGPLQPFLAVAANQGRLALGDTPKRRDLLQNLLGMEDAPRWWPCPPSMKVRPKKVPWQFLGYSLSYDQLADYAKKENLCKNARKDLAVSSIALDATQHIKARFNPQLEPVVMRVGDGPLQPFLAIAANQACWRLHELDYQINASDLASLYDDNMLAQKPSLVRAPTTTMYKIFPITPLAVTHPQSSHTDLSDSHLSESTHPGMGGAHQLIFEVEVVCTSIASGEISETSPDTAGAPNGDADGVEHKETWIGTVTSLNPPSSLRQPWLLSSKQELNNKCHLQSFPQSTQMATSRGPKTGWTRHFSTRDNLKNDQQWLTVCRVSQHALAVVRCRHGWKLPLFRRRGCDKPTSSKLLRKSHSGRPKPLSKSPCLICSEAVWVGNGVHPDQPAELRVPFVPGFY